MIASKSPEKPEDFHAGRTRPRPLPRILDEVGYYCVTGMAIMAAQGRSLGFSLVFATQDIPAMLRENDKEAKSIIANTTTKIFMRVEELEMTAKLAVDSAGEGMKTQVGGFAGQAGQFNTGYNDDMSARIEKVSRINPLDLRALGVGEAYVTWHDQYFKVKAFHAFPEGEYKNLPKLELRVNHFISVARPNPSDVQKEETLPLIAEKLADPRFAQVIEQRARDERAAIERNAAEKKDPARMRSEVACAATAFLRANKKQGQFGDYLTAACAALAAITTAQAHDANIFIKEVRRMEGLPDGPLAGLPAADRSLARSGKGRVPSDIPGRDVAGRGGPTAGAGISSRAAAIADLERERLAQAGAKDPMAAFAASQRGAAARPGVIPGQIPGRPAPAEARRPVTDDTLPPPPSDEDLGFETEPDYEEAAFGNFGAPELPTDPERLAAGRSDAPSTMRKVDHGVTVDGRDTFKMAEKLQSNDATLRFLEALNFDADEGAEPGVEVVDASIQKAVLFADDEEAPPPPKAAPVADRVEIDRADVMSAKATQWTDRAAKPAAPAAAAAAPARDVKAGAKAGDVDDMTSSFLADLLEDGD